MFNHVWSVICQSSSVDNESNLISLFNCLENITVNIDNKESISSKILIPVSFDLVSYWVIDDVKEEKDLKVKFEVVKPNEEVLITKEDIIKVDGKWNKMRNITKFSGLALDCNDSGRYVVKVYQKEEKEKEFKLVSSVPFDIKIQ